MDLKGDGPKDHITKILDHLDEERMEKHKAYMAYVNLEQEQLNDKCLDKMVGEEMGQCYFEEGKAMEIRIEEYMHENEIGHDDDESDF